MRPPVRSAAALTGPLLSFYTGGTNFAGMASTGRERLETERVAQYLVDGVATYRIEPSAAVASSLRLSA